MMENVRNKKDVVKLSDKVIIYGGGSGAVKTLPIIKAMNENARIIAVIDRNTENVRKELREYEVHTPEFLKTVSESCDMIIGSMYCDQIYKRLQEEGYLQNPNLKSIYTVNYYHSRPPYDTGEVEVEADEYKVIKQLLKDEYSQQLIDRIIKERIDRKNDSSELLKDVKDELDWASDEDYWKRVKGKKRYDKTIVIDVGAYRGEKVEEICEALQGCDKYYAFEPIKENYEYLQKMEIPFIEEFKPVMCALGKIDGNVKMENGEDVSHIEEYVEKDGESVIKISKIDSMNFEEIADYYIKMDIEGSEMDALKGGEEFIKKHKPNLAICVYHKTRDIIDIPLYLKSLVPEYEFYLSGGAHTIVIAKP